MTEENKPAKLEDDILKDVAGGQGSKLDEYLRKIAPDKTEVLVSQGGGKELHLDSTLHYDDSGKAYVLKRERDDAVIAP